MLPYIQWKRSCPASLSPTWLISIRLRTRVPIPLPAILRHFKRELFQLTTICRDTLVVQVGHRSSLSKARNRNRPPWQLWIRHSSLSQALKLSETTNLCSSKVEMQLAVSLLRLMPNKRCRLKKLPLEETLKTNAEKIVWTEVITTLVNSLVSSGNGHLKRERPTKDRLSNTEWGGFLR